jgi:hypothetical protein
MYKTFVNDEPAMAYNAVLAKCSLLQHLIRSQYDLALILLTD